MIRLALLATITVTCGVPPESAEQQPCDVQEDCDAFDLNACIDGTCQDYVPRECSSQDDCECDEVCGDTRTCVPTCEADVDCAAVQPWTCGDGFGYCVIPCGQGEACPEGQFCSADGVCWYPPA